MRPELRGTRIPPLFRVAPLVCFGASQSATSPRGSWSVSSERWRLEVADPALPFGPIWTASATGRAGSPYGRGAEWGTRARGFHAQRFFDASVVSRADSRG